MRGLLVVCLLAGCDRTSAVHGEPVTHLDASTTAAAPTDAAAPVTCRTEPTGGVVIPDSAHATQVRIAAAGSKALVTFWESKKRAEGPDVDAALGYVFDGATSSLGPRTKLEENDVGDEPVSAAAPVAVSGDVFAISCAWAAPAGKYACTRTKPGDKPISLFAFAGIANGGPEKPDIAAVVKGEEALVVVPVGRDLQLFSTRVSAKKTDSPFTARPAAAQTEAVDAMTATLSGDDEATIVYRRGAAVVARRAGFDQKWHGGEIALGAKGTLAGAPAVAGDASEVVALFSERAKAVDPWKIVVAELSTTGAVKRTELATGPAEAQGPGIAPATRGCFYVSWVDGAGKSTRTKLALACNGAIAPSSVTALSSTGIEGGRAYLASDPKNPSTLFAVWQEIPTGKGAELRVAKLTCN